MYYSGLGVRLRSRAEPSGALCIPTKPLSLFRFLSFSRPRPILAPRAAAACPQQQHHTTRIETREIYRKNQRQLHVTVMGVNTVAQRRVRNIVRYIHTCIHIYMNGNT